ncbi:MAG TPA: NPCBM/NEW2 domain-containing protein [Urbifossiella sp.]|nr:NPCBM/NEW2 domain-containing protein [Urbifossiella sp.]
MISRALVALTLVALVVAARADDVTTLGGKKLTGKLVAVDAEGVTVDVAGTAVKVPAKEVLLIDLGHKVAVPAKDQKYHEVELTDGSVLRVGKFAVKGKTLEVELLAGPAGVTVPTLEVPLSAVFSVCRNADDAKHRENWQAMLRTRGKRDLYVLRTVDGLSFVQGTILEGNADGTEVTFEKDGGVREQLRLSRATGGLVFSQPPGGQPPTTLCKLKDVFGNTLVAREIGMADGGVKVKTVSGVSVGYPAAAAVAQLDYSQGNVAYLSDLTPQVEAPGVSDADAKAFPLLEGKTRPAPYLRDRFLGESPGLTLDGHLFPAGAAFPKGIAVSADTALTFPLGGDYREFRALVGFADARHGNAAELKLTVEADGKVIATDVFKGKDKARALTVDVKGVRSLRIAVDRDYPSETAAYLILADAKVQK